MEVFKVQSSRKQGSLRYYSGLLKMTVRDVRRKLLQDGGREELDAKIIALGIAVEYPESPRMSLQDELVSVNEDSLRNCVLSFNRWSKSDKTKNKYAYNESAKTDLMFMKLWVDLAQGYKRGKKK